MKSPVTAKVEPDTMEGIDDYQDERDIENRSEAVRRLLRSGLKRETAGPFGGNVDPYAFALGITGSIGILGWLGGDIDFTAGMVAAAFLATGFYLRHPTDTA